MRNKVVIVNQSFCLNSNLFCCIIILSKQVQGANAAVPETDAVATNLAAQLADALTQFDTILALVRFCVQFLNFKNKKIIKTFLSFF